MKKYPLPRKTQQVRKGWDGIRSIMTCILNNGNEAVIECRNQNEDQGVGVCICEGCENARSMRAAIDWIDARI